MASRDEAKALAAIQKMELELAQLGLKLGEGGVGVVKLLKLDLSSPVSARDAAVTLLGMEKRLDILGEHAFPDSMLELTSL